MDNRKSRFEDEINFFTDFHELEYWLDVTDVGEFLSRQLRKIFENGFSLDSEEIVDWVISWGGNRYSTIRIGFTSRYRSGDVRLDTIESDGTVINKKLDLFFQSGDIRENEDAVIKYLRNAGRIYLDGKGL